MMKHDPDFLFKSAEQLQEEGRRIEAWGGFVYRIHASQVDVFVEYQVPFLLIEPIPTTDLPAPSSQPQS